MRYAILLLLSLFTMQALAQKEANVWHFGNGLCLDFNSGVPVEVSGSAMWTFEGCASVCDSVGQLLFYTNGGGRVPQSGQDPGRIWNKNNAVMYDMQGLEGGGLSSSQSSVIFPVPGEKKKYYVFTMDEIEHYIDATPEILAQEPNGRGLRYFIVDMNLNGGLGGVSEADVLVYDYSFEGLCAIRHENKNDYWVLINQDTTGLGVYSVTSSGVALAGVYPYTGYYIKSSPTNPNSAVPCCNKVITSSGILLDFNTGTGVLSNPVDLINSNGSNNAFEFSPNSFYLYGSVPNDVTGINELIRYNMLLASQTGQSLESTAEVIESSFDPIYMQLAPDGNIYFLQSNNFVQFSIGAINCPNTNTPSVSYDLFTYDVVSGDDIFFSLPNYPSWIFYNSYDAKIEFGPDTIYLCPGDSFLLDAGVGTFWEWGGDCFSGPQNTWPDNSTRYFTVTQPGVYSATLTGTCGLASDQIWVLPCNNEPDPCQNVTLTIGPDTTICKGSPLVLTVPGYESYLWQDGSTAPSITITSAGTYILTVTDTADCSITDTLAVDDYTPAVVATTTKDSICRGESIALTASGADTYVWTPNTGLTCISCAAPLATPPSTITYQVTGTDDAGCSASASLIIYIECNEIIEVPSAFSPNGDGKNDLFRLLVKGPVELNSFIVFNRWGQVVFETNDLNAGWNGQFNNTDQAVGTYVYSITAKNTDNETIILQGNVTLIR